MSGVWALIPVKTLARGKSRLAGLLSATERQELTLAMLRDVLCAVTGSRLQGGVVVHTDPVVADLARAAGLTVLQESSPSDLNGALRQGLEHLDQRGARGALIVPADVPLMLGQDIDEILSHGPRAPVVAIVPSADSTGTNALLLQPPSVIAPAFGRGSYRAHLNVAMSAGLPCISVENSRVALDLDEPVDLERFLGKTPAGAAADFLRGLRLEERLSSRT